MSDTPDRVTRRDQLRREARDTEGRRLLAERLASHPVWNVSRLATAFGLSQPSVGGWVRGQARPEVPWRMRLEMLLGIPADAWLTETERQIIADGAPASSPALPTDDAPDAA